MFAGSGKLKPQEVSKALDKIRQEYDHFIVRYFKTQSVRKQFEDRLRMADLKRMDMTFFIAQEMKVLQELILQAESDKAEEERKEALARTKKNTSQGKSYADRVLEKLQKQIEDYPSLAVHPGVSTDVEKIYGTLNWIFLSLWPNLAPILRDLGLPHRIPLEEAFIALTPNQGRLPKDLEHLAHLVESGASLNHQSQQQKICLVKAAAQVNTLLSAVNAAGGHRITDSQRLYLNKLGAYFSKVIQDFRLKNIIPV